MNEEENSDLLELVSKLELDKESVMELVRQYGMAEVTSILTTLTQQKAAKGYYNSPYYGRVTRVDITDVSEYVRLDAEKK